MTEYKKYLVKKHMTETLPKGTVFSARPNRGEWLLIANGESTLHIGIETWGLLIELGFIKELENEKTT